jgi:sigma-B regulation protein RsbU (phosphoserine phosphatase)
LELAAHYQTSKRAGGDYYDFFPLPDGQWGLLIADVSGHGTPAAVIMAVTHSIAHTAHRSAHAAQLAAGLHQRSSDRALHDDTGTFVTAFTAFTIRPRAD